MVKKFKISKEVSKEPALIIYDQLMLTPGIWNGVKFSKDQIIFGIQNTDWTNPENYALIDRHTNGNELPLANSWQGYFENIQYKTIDDGVEKEGMYGDLNIYDISLASKIFSKKSPLAVSIDASYSRSTYGAQKMSFSNTALVYRPGCLDAYIQLESNGDNNKIRLICEEDISITNDKEIQSIKLNFELETDKIVQVYSKENDLMFEGSVLSFNKSEDIIMVSIMNEHDIIQEFSMNDFLFFPIMPRMIIEETDQSEDNSEEIMVEPLEKKDNINIIRKEDINLKMNDIKNIESLDARISLIEDLLEKNKIKLSEEVESKDEEVSEKESEEKSEEEVKEVEESKEEKTEEVESETKEESEKVVEEVEEKTEEVELESEEESKEEKVESKEESEEKSETKVEEVSKEEVKEEAKESEEKVQAESIEKLTSEISELKAKLAEKEEVKEEVKLESKEKKVAESKTVVQLESKEESEEKSEEESEKPKEKVQLSKMDQLIARLNNRTI